MCTTCVSTLSSSASVSWCLLTVHCRPIGCTFPHLTTWLNLSLILTVEDLERHDGSLQKPYYMSKNLMKILNKSNKAAKTDRKKKWRTFYLLSSWTQTNSHIVSGYNCFFSFQHSIFFRIRLLKTNLLILHFLFYCVCEYVVLMTVHMKKLSVWGRWCLFLSCILCDIFLNL